MNKAGFFALLLLIIVTVLFLRNKSPLIELFETQEGVCPVEARREPDGFIHVKPGKHTFATMSEYVSYLSNLYAQGVQCIPPKVHMSKDVPLGIFGGLGNGAITPSGTNRESAARVVLDTNSADNELSVKSPIDKLDDYEYTRVDESERVSRNAMKREVKSALIEQNRLDWANLPFNAEARAGAEDEFIAGRMQDMWKDPKTGVFFKNLEGVDTQPPDEDAVQQREARILASYRPTDLTEHKVDKETDAVAKLVNEIYAKDKNWEPVVSRTGENKWEVTELIPKARKERWEDDQAVSVAMATEKGMLQVKPQVDIMNRLQDDPYFDKSGVADSSNNRFWNYKDFTKWTPGLERMFAPTSDNRQWD